MKLREIERLRAIAILMVMVVHWDCFYSLLPEIARQSWTGVDLFFVISGYVVTLSLVRLLPPLEGEEGFLPAFARARDALKTFYTRRLFRIVPAAGAVLLLQRVLVGIFPQEYGSAPGWWSEVVAFFGGVYNYARAFHRDYHMGILWSLAVEEHFYLVLPLLFVAVRTTGRRLAACVVIAAASIACRAMQPPPDALNVDYATFASHLRFDSLMAGVALALVSTKAAAAAPILPRALVRWAVIPACIVLVACMPAATPDAVMRHEGFVAAWGLSAILVGFAALDRGYVLSVPLLGRALEHVGSRSYALYLVHVQVTRLFAGLWAQYPEIQPLFPADQLWRRFPVVFPAALLAAELLHRLVERPFLRLGRALSDPEQRAGVAFPPAARRWVSVAALLAAVVYARHGLLRLLGPRDLALHAQVTASSQQDGKPGPESLVNGKLETEFGLHTDHQSTPWATIDLGVPTKIGAIRVYNRADGYQDEQLPLELSVSDDGFDFRVIARREVMFTQALPWRIRVEGPPVRYVRLSVPRETTLCLSEVEIYEPRWMAALP